MEHGFCQVYNHPLWYIVSLAECSSRRGKGWKRRESGRGNAAVFIFGGRGEQKVILIAETWKIKNRCKVLKTNVRTRS
jgi:hypothetical protein